MAGVRVGRGWFGASVVEEYGWSFGVRPRGEVVRRRDVPEDRQAATPSVECAPTVDNWEPCDSKSCRATPPSAACARTRWSPFVGLRWFGSEAVELTYKSASGAVANELLYRRDEARLEIVERGRP